MGPRPSSSGRSATVGADGARHHPVRQEAAEDLGDQRIERRGGRAEQRHLDDRTDVEVERAEEAAEPGGIARHEVTHRTQGGHRARPVVGLSGEHAEPQERLDRHRAAGRHGVVEEIAGPDDQALVIDARVVEALRLVVPEETQHLVGQPARLVDEAALERGLVHLDQRRRDHRVVLEIGLQLGPAVLPGAEEAPVGPHRAEHEVGVPDGRGDVIGTAERAAGLRERATGQPVPGGQDLVVAPGMHAPLADGEELGPGRGHPLGRGLARHPQDVLALEVRAAIDAPVSEHRPGVLRARGRR